MPATRPQEANAAEKLDIAFRRNLLSARVLYEVKQGLRSAEAAAQLNSGPRPTRELQVRDLEDFVVFENDTHEVTFYAHGDNVSVYRDGAFDPDRRDFRIPHDVTSLGSLAAEVAQLIVQRLFPSARCTENPPCR